MHDSKCCKRLFSFPLESLTKLNSSAWLQSCKGLLSFPIARGCLNQPSSIAWLQMLQSLFSFPLARGESYPTKFKCTTPNVANVFSHSHLKGGSLNQPNSGAWLQILQTSSLIPIRKGESYPSKFQCMTLDVANVFLIPIRNGGVLSSRTSVYDSKSCKRLFLFLLARGKSYTFKLQCMTLNVGNVFSLSH